MDQHTFEEKVIKSGENLFGLAMKLYKDEEKANDLVQETVYKALVNREKYKENVNFDGWMYTIMRNIFINEYRKNTKYPILHDTTDTGYIFNTGKRVVRNDGESNVSMQEIKSAMDKVDVKYAVPFKMYFEGYKYEEIAEKTNLPLGTIKSRIFKARQFMQQTLEHLYHTPEMVPAGI